MYTCTELARTDHHFSQANGRIATKLAHDGLQVSVHPGVLKVKVKVKGHVIRALVLTKKCGLLGYVELFIIRVKFAIYYFLHFNTVRQVAARLRATSAIHYCLVHCYDKNVGLRRIKLKLCLPPHLYSVAILPSKTHSIANTAEYFRQHVILRLIRCQ